MGHRKENKGVTLAHADSLYLGLLSCIIFLGKEKSVKQKETMPLSLFVNFGFNESGRNDSIWPRQSPLFYTVRLLGTGRDIHESV